MLLRERTDEYQQPLERSLPIALNLHMELICLDQQLD